MSQALAKIDPKPDTRARLQTTALDRLLLSVAPKWALERVRARAAAETILRHFDAAGGGRRTQTWAKNSTDANMAAWGALGLLRWNSRELLRNNAWAQNGRRTISRNTVGWGIVPKAVGPAADKAQQLFVEWGGADEGLSTQCDADRRCTFYGLQRLLLDAIVSDGEVLIRRRPRRATDGHTIPLQLQVLEADFLDIAKTGIRGPAGGPTIQGVEFDQLGKRTAYWLFEIHPGSGMTSLSLKSTMVSKRIPAEEVLHLFRIERPGQVRGVPWFASVILKLKDFDEYDDATLMRQKIAACFTAFVTDTEGTAANLGDKDPDDDSIESLEPGLINYLPIGKSITFANPPGVNDHSSYSASNLRQIAAGIGVPYEELSGDYSQVNFSSSRMARLAHWGNVHDWRWNLMIPACARIWEWAMTAAELAGELPAEGSTGAKWTPPPMPMVDPEKEGLGIARLVRAGAMTPSAMVREQGEDPDSHWKEYGADLKKLDAAGIVLDSDARKTTQAGLAQPAPGASDGGDPAAATTAPPKNGKAPGAPKAAG